MLDLKLLQIETMIFIMILKGFLGTECKCEQFSIIVFFFRQLI